MLLYFYNKKSSWEKLSQLWGSLYDPHRSCEDLYMFIHWQPQCFFLCKFSLASLQSKYICKYPTVKQRMFIDNWIIEMYYKLYLEPFKTWKFDSLIFLLYSTLNITLGKCDCHRQNVLQELKSETGEKTTHLKP